MRARSLTAPRLTLLVLAVTGIVVGLLGMHTMILPPSEGDHSTMSSAATNAATTQMPTAMPMNTAPIAAASTLTTGTMSPTTTTTTTTHGEPAGGDCGTCMAVQMTCVLSLLVIGAMLLRGPTPGHNLLTTFLASVRAHLTSRVPPRRTPSLDVLCISRT